MQWLGAILILSFAVGLRRRPGRGAHALLVAGIAVITGLWYLQLGRGG